jgi:MFS family permease
MPPALRHPAYRAYWLGMLAAVSGFQMFHFSQIWLMYQLTGSPLYLGYVAAATAVPGILLNLFGGVLADKLDKRRLIMVTEVIAAGLVLLLATLTLLGVVNKWHVLAIAFLAGGVDAFNSPARLALFPHLIDRRAMLSAVALNASIWQGTRIVAPAVAGAIIAVAGTAASLYLAGVGFLTMAAVIYGLRIPRIDRGAQGSAVQEMVEGLKFIRKNSIFSSLIGMSFFNSFFGMAYIMLMPVFAVDILKVGAQGQGLLLSLSGVGALLATLWLSSRGNVRYKGLLIIGGAVLFGLSVAAFALTSRFVGYYPLALALMFVVGVCNSVYMISIQSSLQMLVPDWMQGRVMGFYGMTYSIMPLGGMQAGALANFIGAPFSIAIGGLAVAAFALGPGLLNRQVRNLGALLRQAEQASTSADQGRRLSPSVADG